MSQDADVILLDQRVRLLEMINSFQENAEAACDPFEVSVSVYLGLSLSPVCSPHISSRGHR